MNELTWEEIMHGNGVGMGYNVIGVEWRWGQSDGDGVGTGTEICPCAALWSADSVMQKSWNYAQRFCKLCDHVLLIMRIMFSRS